MERAFSWVALLAIINAAFGLIGLAVTGLAWYGYLWAIAEFIAIMCIFCGGSKDGLR
jgi:hypothetical protein